MLTPPPPGRSLFSAEEQQQPITIGGETIWIAPIASLDTSTDDGRIFHYSTETPEPDPGSERIPLTTVGQPWFSQTVVGRVTDLQIRGGYLIAQGVVDDPDAERRMRSGGLRPGPDFLVRRTLRIGGQLHVYSPRILALGLTTQPAWSDPSLRFSFPPRIVPPAVFVEAPEEIEPGEEDD